MGPDGHPTNLEIRVISLVFQNSQWENANGKLEKTTSSHIYMENDGKCHVGKKKKTNII